MNMVEINDRVLEIIHRLKKKYPVIKTALYYKTPFELLVATILSAQTTDIQVNKITKTLFSKYNSIQHFAEADLETLQNDIRSINYYKTKAKNIQECARIILERFNGEVPKTITELTSLPGVARKTANIVISSAFGLNEGIAVDTHVKRLSFRLGLTTNQDPVKIEKDLMSLVPKEEWGNFSNLLIFHGRDTCQSINPKHEECALNDLCPQLSTEVKKLTRL